MTLLDIKWCLESIEGWDRAAELSRRAWAGMKVGAVSPSQEVFGNNSSLTQQWYGVGEACPYLVTP